MSRAPEATRSRLIAAATAEIRKIGPRRMTVLHVANGLGMSHANVYRHFPDKTGLIDAVLNGWLKGLEQRLGEIVEGPDPADDKLERYFATLSRAYAETLRDDPAIFRLLAEPENGAEEPRRHRQSITRQVGRIVEEGISTRLFAGSEARRSAQLALDLAHRFADARAVLLTGDDPSSDARRDRAIRAIIRALGSRK
ncbi:MAG: TetR/AcrR family transcriptional regulator [Methylobacterium sp.]|jgi:AcrR family transcriptional regulator|nr:TetR/AcrR family transcriptional regulator [Methylobacterium sp.]MCA3616946.1 TetR/AcrR family transcriptional regulator [Methylobacterium sp.]MCA3621465.1 TetR/AcrR family transcriptional regulator [Methylobacterium sp.]MCA3626391.1 TetR/AcrR family transcriptional regulator [Methylobacterium sp.]